MTSTPTDVISEVLTADALPTADDILNALDNAGYMLIRPDNSGPAWMPVTPRALAKVKQFAALAKSGKPYSEIATEMELSPRQVERYGAAANHLGLIGRRR
ncbi:helix-turn-helix domain-containing protein [Microtetraspora malaysiensis]|uniref:helix-turn-helix domain-containing protein n=1 Tax=Microtetraspora malaysiensis TaxID=161358 RepID=UPI003D92DA45